jgi:copper chaperone CopZ
MGVLAGHCRIFAFCRHSVQRYAEVVATQSDTIQVAGVRCERCVMRLAHVLEGFDGLESANANLMGQVSLAWDDDKTSRDAIVDWLKQSGFPELTAV